MPITLVLPFNQELFHIIMTHNNNKIAEIVGLTSEKELCKYFGNDMRITHTKCMYMYLVRFVFMISLGIYVDVMVTKKKVCRTP